VDIIFKSEPATSLETVFDSFEVSPMFLEVLGLFAQGDEVLVRFFWSQVLKQSLTLLSWISHSVWSMLDR
jgi:hypothetical protein